MRFVHRFAVPVLLLCLLGSVAARDDHETQGDQAFQKGDYKKAVKEYKKAVKEEAKRADLHFKLGMAYLKKGDVDEAIPEFIRTTNLDPDNEAAYQHLGDFFLVKKQPDKAAKAFENLVRINPESAQYQFQLGKVQDSLRQDDQALTHFYKAVLINPRIEDAYPYLFKLLKRKILQNPGDPDPHMVLGRVYRLHGDLGEAKIQFALVADAQPQSRDAWEELLDVCRKLKDCRCEVTSLEGLLQFSPKDLTLVDAILEVARRCEMPDVREHYLQFRISLTPRQAPAYAELGKLYQSQDNRTQAYFYFKKYLELCAACPDSRTLREWCANEELANPDIARQYQAFNLFQTGLESFRNGRFEAALRDLEQSRSIYDQFPQVHFYIGQTLEELDRRPEALYAYKEAIKLQPGNPEYWFFLGSALDSQKMYDNAAICFRKVRELDPGNSFGYTLQAQNKLQSYQDQGIIKREGILDKGH